MDDFNVEHCEHLKVSYVLVGMWYDYVNGGVISNVASFTSLEVKVKDMLHGNYLKRNAPLDYYAVFSINSYFHRFNLVVESEPLKHI